MAHCGCDTTKMVPNPIPASWAVDIIARSYATIQATVRPEWLPKLEDVESIGHGRAQARIHEYGCGEYGCVLPTLDPGVVLKVTSDDTEAQFAAHLAHTMVAPICVDYHQVMSLNTKYKGNGVYLVWRESADSVGKLYEVAQDGDMARELIGQQHAAAKIAFDAALEGDASWLDMALDGWAQALAEMAAVPELSMLATGMLQVYREQHILFGDIHEGNIGVVHRDGQALWVITDPGHVAVIER
jgi:hypothetical protein